MSVRIITGDCRQVLATLPAESVHCVVTSPPYWGLRDYGTAKWDGGDPACDHSGRKNSDHSGEVGPRNESGNAFRNSSRYVGQGDATKAICGKCGARRIDNQIGLEPSYQDFVAEMVAVFREVRRVLRADGACWVNLGDSYVHGAPGGGSVFDNGRTDGRISYEGDKVRGRTKTSTMMAGLKPKDLCGIPWRVAFALQADGWWLRQDIIWSKPNPMPESVTDRCTKAHEYLFLLSKGERYYYDAEAIKEPASDNTHARTGKIKMPDGWDTGAGGHGSFHREGREKGKIRERAPGVTPKSASNSSLIKAKESFHASTTEVLDRRNKRSVWTIATEPFSEAHFATFPPALIEPCILAGCPKGGTVLDPFGGAGTTGLVADRLQRDAILIELNPDYAAMARRRIDGDAPLFASAAE